MSSGHRGQPTEPRLGGARPAFMRRRDLPCRRVDPDLFFPESGAPSAAKPAKDVCRPCPARRECLRFALDHGEAGIWGATSDIERRAIVGELARRERVDRIFGRSA